MAGALTFVSPLGALVALAALAPLLALALAGRRVAAVRAALRLTPPTRREAAIDAAALAAVFGLLGLAAAQPAVSSRSARHVRTDAQAFVVLDTSRSMLAAAGPAAATRLDRAKAAAIALRGALPEVETGVGTLTDRVLPNLLPTIDGAAFDTTVRQAVQIERPPPERASVVATSFGALAQVATGDYFAPAARHRVLVVLTDGESAPYDTGEVARALGAKPGVGLVLVHVWRAGEGIFDAGRRDPAYRPDPTSRAQLDALALATQGSVFEESSVDAAAARARGLLGSGPTALRGNRRTTAALGPYAALLALVPLLLFLWRRYVR